MMCTPRQPASNPTDTDKMTMISAKQHEINNNTAMPTTTAGGIRRQSICCILAILCVIPTSSWAFAPSKTNASRMIHRDILPTPLQAATQPPPKSPSSPSREKNKKSNNNKKKNKYKTIGDMMKAMEKNPNQFVANGAKKELNANGRWVDGKKKPKRSRQRVDRPKQTYLYASQRRALDMEPPLAGGKKQKKHIVGTEDDTGLVDSGGEDDDDDYYAEEAAAIGRMNMNPQQQHRQMQLEKMEFVRSLGLAPASQVADAVVGDGPEDVPRIVGTVRVDGSSEDDDGVTTSNSFAYVLYKPVGWSIVGEKKKKGGVKKNTTEGGANADGDDVVSATVPSTGVSTSADGSSATGDPATPTTTAGGSGSNNKSIKRVKAYDEQTDEFTFVEYNEADVLAMLTPEERADLLKEGGLNLDDDLAEMAQNVLAGTEWDDDENEADLSNGDDGSTKKKKKKKNGTNSSESGASTNAAATSAPPQPRGIANLNSPTRPSVVNWLKQLKSTEGTPIKGGKNWVALSGATEIDDSGLVLLCPKDRIDAVHVDRCSYIAVVGNGKKLVSRSKLLKSSSAKSSCSPIDDSTAQVEILSRLKRGRDVDPVMTVAVNYPDGAMSTSSHVVLLCQDRFHDGIRGDALSDPLDRRASRRLVHCSSMAVSSLVNLDDGDDSVMVAEECDIPDDVANYANRRDDAVFTKGSFLGRQLGLGRNELTNAYREINGGADGFPGWIVDRYDEWLFVQHDNEGPMSMQGPLPSLHDGSTAGVYYLPTQADRSIMGTEKLKPTLLEGRAAPSDFIPVTENGINYLVNLDESFSTGIFLDQRHQRAYLAQQCNEETRVLNCFAHTGAFSVAAAATSGAKTVSLDLDKKWLDRVRPQMEANGIMEWEGCHDCIYGDCFDWLARLAKRGEQFDIVILDPPSTSVGKKKKRWSVKNDMAELVALAAPLVKSNGLLFTTTNSASLRADKFAKMCKKGLMDAGVKNPKLERVSPMPSDFLSVGSQPVKNLVWRIP